MKYSQMIAALNLPRIKTNVLSIIDRLKVLADEVLIQLLHQLFSLLSRNNL